MKTLSSTLLQLLQFKLALLLEKLDLLDLEPLLALLLLGLLMLMLHLADGERGRPRRSYPGLIDRTSRRSSSSSSSCRRCGARVGISGMLLVVRRSRRSGRTQREVRPRSLDTSSRKARGEGIRSQTTRLAREVLLLSAHRKTGRRQGTCRQMGHPRADLRRRHGVGPRGMGGHIQLVLLR